MPIYDNNESSYSTEIKTSFLSEVMHDLKRSLRGAPHTMDEIRQSLVTAKRIESDFIDILKRHHDYLKESIVVLLDRVSTEEEKKFHLDRFLQLVDMHNKAEEETLYVELAKNFSKEARLEGLLGEEEHEIAFELSDELRDMHFETYWSEEVDAKARVVAGLMANHIKEEENQMFPITRDSMSDEKLKSLAFDYLNKCENRLRLVEIKSKGLFL